MSEDWEYSERDCPKCQSQLATRLCAVCGGEGYFDEEEDTDVSLGDEPCDHCSGDGHETWCRECGWDMNFKCFLSPEYERAYNEKRAVVVYRKGSVA